MEQMLDYKGFRGTVETSEEDGCMFGRVAGIDDLVSYEGTTMTELRQSFEEAVEHYLETCGALGQPAEASRRRAAAPGEGKV